MENNLILFIAILIFIAFIFSYWKITRSYGEKEYGPKLWKHWPTRLAYWQGAILYSMGFTAITLYVLKWSNVLSF